MRSLSLTKDEYCSRGGGLCFFVVTHLLCRIQGFDEGVSLNGRGGDGIESSMVDSRQAYIWRWGENEKGIDIQR